MNARRFALLAALALPALALAAKDDKKKKEEPKWDVSKPAGPRRDVKLDVDEGTWMAVDVSPDGTEIVFDLLGDLYMMPIAGGDAKALTSGVAWDMQPRFSPDGKKIAFTSDRAGGDNLWVIDRDGKNAKQISTESFRLVNSPAWSPDGEWIAGHKHFTSKRSLGAGEMWLWHSKTGGDGLQATDKPSDQKDAGEPAFSPDGRYLYWSQDVYPGRNFEYNKDPNAQIYAIQRLDRETGEQQTIVGGNGGSIRPTPSHDGKQLAFVRRIRAKTVLMTVDLASGAERVIWDGLERDMQETWAIHGVYPGFAWTPDDSAIVLWAGGKIRRVDVANKQVATIPFRVKDVRSVAAEALRFPQTVAPASFRPKMLRSVQVSPDGSRVLFQSLGKLWVRDLPSGTPKRLTKQDDHFEQQASWSRDGKWIVYTTWDDEKAGSIRVVSSASGDGRTVTSTPGHYFEPALSPDGSTVVYRKGGDGYLRTALWSRDPGLYWVGSAGGGTPKKIVSDGYAPHFGSGNDRVYFTHANESSEDKTPDVYSLKSIDLDGSDERTHFTTDEGVFWRVSPDEKWVAWQENFKVFLAEFARTGRAIDVSPDAKNVPVAKVTRDAGDFLHFSGDSKRVWWSLGSELFSRDLKDAFSFLAGAPEKLPDPPEKGIDLSFDVPADVPAGTTAFTGARIVTSKGDEVIEDGVVVVVANRIAAVGPRGKVAVPQGAKVIDVAGKTILPGFVDVHWHGSMATDGIVPEQSWVNYASLAFGVTTIHDPSNDTQEVFAASEMARAGVVVGPRIYSTGTILYGAKGAGYRAPVDSIDDARGHLRRMKAAGAFSVKSYNQPRREQRQQIIQAGRELGMMVVPEGASLFHHNMTEVVDGHTGIEHTLPVPNVYADVTQLWGGTKTGYTPTLVVAYGGFGGEGYWYAKTNVWENERLLSFVPRRIVDEASRRRLTLPDEEYNHFNEARVAKSLANAGVGVNLGAHGQREGLAAHWELWMFEQGGMSRLEAIRACTINGAKYLGLDKDVGSLEAGKLADLMVIDGNPLENLRDSVKVRFTMVNGRLYDAATMNEIGNRPRERKPFFFEGEDGNQGWKKPAEGTQGMNKTIEGKAENAKGGAVVVGDDGSVIYLANLDSWPDELHRKRVRATGRLGSVEHENPSKDGIQRAGMQGTQTLLYEATWELVK